MGRSFLESRFGNLDSLSKQVISLYAVSLSDPSAHVDAIASQPPETESTMDNPQYLAPQDLADRYAAVWNEADPDARRKSIAALWPADGEHYVRMLEARGYEALEK
jgi:hypothetical protein